MPWVQLENWRIEECISVQSGQVPSFRLRIAVIELGFWWADGWWCEVVGVGCWMRNPQWKLPCRFTSTLLLSFALLGPLAWRFGTYTNISSIILSLLTRDTLSASSSWFPWVLLSSKTWILQKACYISWIIRFSSKGNWHLAFLVDINTRQINYCRCQSYRLLCSSIFYYH